MEKEIYVLCVEDNPADVVVLNHALREGGLRFRSKRVDTRQAFLHELEHSPPDLILSDHGLVSFDGFTALAIARDRCPEVPFIFVTGALGEAMAIETLKCGATDYVLKTDLAKLAPAVTRALHEAKERAASRRTDQQLRQSEERFRMLVEGVKDYAIVMLDACGRIASWNSGAHLIHGYLAEEVLGRDFSVFFTKADQARRWPQTILRRAAGQGRLEEEGWRLRKGGLEFQANVVVTALQDDARDLRGFAQVTRDITARKTAEAELRRSEALKAAILDTALDAVISINHQGRIQEWNQAAQGIFGYTRDQALGCVVDELIVPPSMQEVYPEGLAQYLMNGVGTLIGRPVELTLRRGDASEFAAEVAISRIFTEAPPGFTALIRDITDRKRAEAALRESEERFRMLVEGVREYAIYMLDAAGCIVTWNSGAENLEGYTAEEILGKSLAIFFTPEDVRNDLPARLLKQAEAEGQVANQGWRRRKDGSRFWSEGIITALRDEKGRLHGFSKIAHDVTKSKEAEAEIRRLNEQLDQRVRERTAQLEAANQELEAFTYSVSHDLRAPLRHISGYVEVLQRNAQAKLDEAGRQLLQTIADAANTLGDLIDALLDFSRMGRAELNRQPVDLAVLLQEARHEMRRETNGRDVDWRIGPLPSLQGDPFLLRQVLINLISNALKYTRKRKRAKIEIGAIESPDEITCFVRDNGVGFDMQYADRLFGVFQRLHPAAEFEGIGIGLANVQRIIHRHGGRVWAEGAINAGASFFFSLPKQPKGQ